MDIFRSKAIEALLLTDNRWQSGSMSGANLIGQMRYAAIESLSVQQASDEVRQEALRLLRDKYEVEGRLTNSSSFDRQAPQGTMVLRVISNGPTDELGKLNAVRQLANLKAWKLNQVDGKLAQNLRVDMLNDSQIEHIQRLLKKFGIKSYIADSKSLVSQGTGTIRVIRIVGTENITKLAEEIPTLVGIGGSVAPAAPSNPGRPWNPERKPWINMKGLFGQP